MVLDADSTVWTFKDWGRPTRLVSPSLNHSSPETTPIQVECGPWYCAVLTGSGDVYAWWMYRGTFINLCLEASRTAPVLDHEGVIPCRTREFEMDPIKLSALPGLPNLPATGLPEEERTKETRLIKIAACHDSLIGLTNKGHVLKLDGMGSEDDTRIWYYVSENMRALVHFLKLWCAAAILLRDKRDQEDPSLLSHYGRRWSEKTAASGIVFRLAAHHPRKQHHPDRLRVRGLKTS